MKIQNGLPIQRPALTKADVDNRTREAAQMYEQHFLREMVKSMRKTVEHTNEPSMGERIYAEQLDAEYVDSWGKQGGIGLADIIYNQLQDRFFGQGQAGPRPAGPVQIEKGTTLKIDETRQQQGLPILNQKSTLPTNEVSFLYEWPAEAGPSSREVQSPYGGDVIQSFRTAEDRQILKLAHDDGLVSTLSFLGQTKGLKMGDRVEQGQVLGTLSTYAKGLTWQVGQA